MRKALGLACLGCLLVVGLACSGDSGTPTSPAVDNSSLTAVTAGVAPEKILICHRNVSEPDGVVVDVTAQNAKSHRKHLTSQQDCRILSNSCGLAPGDTCDPDESTFGGVIYICDESCI